MPDKRGTDNRGSTVLRKLIKNCTKFILLFFFIFRFFLFFLLAFFSFLPLHYKTEILQPFEYTDTLNMGSLTCMTMKWSCAVQFVTE